MAQQGPADDLRSCCFEGTLGISAYARGWEDASAGDERAWPGAYRGDVLGRVIVGGLVLNVSSIIRMG